MKAWLQRLSDHLSFTATERAVVLTLVGALLLGLGIRLFRDGDHAVTAFDYSAADAQFAARSQAPPPAGGVPGAEQATAGPSRLTWTEGTARSSDPGASKPGAGPLRIDLNRATKGQLMSLPGVGEVIAERILLFREEHGAFASLNDLLKVKGIGKKKLEHIAPFCIVEP